MEIRPATPEDAEDLARLYVVSAEHHRLFDPAFYEKPDVEAVVTHYHDVLGRDGGDLSARFVAEEAGDVLGLVEVRLPEHPGRHSMIRPRVAMADVVVATDHRRKGVGSALMRRAEMWASEHGAAGVMLDALRANEQALAFYRRLGYYEHGVLLLKRDVTGTPDV